MDNRLIHAIITEDLPTLERLLKKRINVHVRYNGVPAIGLAVELGNKEMVKMLVHAKANINTPFNDGKIVPLNMACYEGDMEMVKLLLDLGAEIDTDKALVSPIFSATKGGHANIIRLLISRGANVNRVIPTKQEHIYTTADGEKTTIISTNNTALHHAIYMYKMDIYDLLIELGADDTIPNSKGVTPKYIKENMVSLLTQTQHWT
jgi:ankyrin repeat protein